MNDTLEYRCDSCGGPLGQRPWHGIPYICGKCEIDTLHDTPDLSGPYIDSYYEIAGVRNTLAKVFDRIEYNHFEITEGVDPIAEVVDQIEALLTTFREVMVESLEEFDGETERELKV